METAAAAVPAAPGTGTAAAAAYEAQHVHAVYSVIAPHFAATRYAPWPAVDAFLAALPQHSLVADLGCGNGKYLLVAAADVAQNLHVFGMDRCAELAAIAAASQAANTSEGAGASKKAGFEVAVADVRHVPVREGVFDAALNIAVVHHLSTRARRVQAWREAVRVLRVGGQLLAYVWALERAAEPQQPRRGNHGRRMLNRRFDAQDVFVPWHMRRRKEGADNDRVLGDPQEVHRRFYHVYCEGELEGELAQVREARVVRSYYDHQNWCAVVERVRPDDEEEGE